MSKKLFHRVTGKRPNEPKIETRHRNYGNKIEGFMHYVARSHDCKDDRGKREVFYQILCIGLLGVSLNCRLRENGNRIVETALRSLLNENKEYFENVAWGKNDFDEFVKEFIEHVLASPDFCRVVEDNLFDYSKRTVAYELTEFPSVPAELREHPMRSLARYLDELEIAKFADTARLKAESESGRLRRAVALFRVGEAVLPRESWQARVKLVCSGEEASGDPYEKFIEPLTF
ncbi:hypothetical protein Rvan_3127 [Rhodomicrobium vannielii ATCC 17100]|uniref:Uncharacterized protein n=1 Tax=Rhodomicrobium vannielii (strain ATCC 17100 / DSM 162 / LMG 4299 / NCIMB 10020 / ATH 3.1.1) TaxID=648757 RepID=E3I106_RHOVT|nr:hypothetical protein [Rhodomicrobium vannielii]ADP72329.1 hypothetical protein Rvan_3127 [Rhodomicrobium vannielii ATCC 17100]